MRVSQFAILVALVTAVTAFAADTVSTVASFPIGIALQLDVNVANENSRKVVQFDYHSKLIRQKTPWGQATEKERDTDYNRKHITFYPDEVQKLVSLIQEANSYDLGADETDVRHPHIVGTVGSGQWPVAVTVKQFRDPRDKHLIRAIAVTQDTTLFVESWITLFPEVAGDVPNFVKALQDATRMAGGGTTLAAASGTSTAPSRGNLFASYLRITVPPNLHHDAAMEAAPARGGHMLAWKDDKGTLNVQVLFTPGGPHWDPEAVYTTWSEDGSRFKPSPIDRDELATQRIGNETCHSHLLWRGRGQHPDGATLMESGWSKEILTSAGTWRVTCGATAEAPADADTTLEKIVTSFLPYSVGVPASSAAGAP